VNISITGITGSGGSYLADYVLEEVPGVENVWGNTRWHSTSNLKNISRHIDRINLIECDLSDLSATIRFLSAAEPDLIFHLAAYANVRTAFDNPLAVVENNVSSTHNLLEAIRFLGIRPKVIMCSTSEVYGKVSAKETPIKETQSLNPASPYAASKAAQEMLCKAYFQSFDIPIVVTRMFTYINPRRRDLFATSFAHQIAMIEAGHIEELQHGNLESIRTLIDVRDAMECYWKVAQHGLPGETYNLGGVNSATVGQILDLLISKSRVPIRKKLDKELLRPTDVTLQIPDCSKFLSLVDWKPKYSLLDSLEFLLDETRKKVNSTNGIL
jgi:GDP-4-dehydro-6-deoxy-D-mannose reductase